jgi:parallel beta-helix repeat protein
MKNLILISLCLTSFIFAQTNYYVSLTGNDSNDGSISAPWKTIQKAANAATAGSIVNVRAGTYSEIVTINVSGNATSGPIVFQNYSGELPVIDASSNAVPSGSTGIFTLIDKSYVTIKGFELENFKTATKNYVPIGIYITGTSNHITIANNKIHNIEQNGTSSSGTDAHGIAVYGTSGTQSINNIIINNNELYALKLGSSESLVVNGNVENFQITNNKVHDNNNIGIDAIGFEGTASANDQARSGIISGNTVYNIESYGNVAYGTDRSADGIYVDGGKNIIIERNIVYRCNIGIELASEHSGKSTSGVIMRNNFISFCGVCGIAMGGYDTKRGSTDSCKALNNTLYANDTLHWETGEFMLQYNMRRNVVKNNLVYANSQNVFMSNPFTQDTANSFNNNLYYYLPGSSDKASFQFQWLKVKYASLAAYQTASGNDANSITSDPLLKNLTSIPPDLHILKNSPAISAGAAVDSVGAYDIDGDARINGTIDIGADEYTAGTKVENNVFKSNTFILKQNYPNPFNPSTTIEYTLLKESHVQLTITDIEGREVARLVDRDLPAGSYKAIFSAQKLASGVYFYHLKAGEFQQTKQMIVLK